MRLNLYCPSTRNNSVEMYHISRSWVIWGLLIRSRAISQADFWLATCNKPGRWPMQAHYVSLSRLDARHPVFDLAPLWLVNSKITWPTTAQYFSFGNTGLVDFGGERKSTVLICIYVHNSHHCRTAPLWHDRLRSPYSKFKGTFAYVIANQHSEAFSAK